MAATPTQDRQPRSDAATAFRRALTTVTWILVGTLAIAPSGSVDQAARPAASASAGVGAVLDEPAPFFWDTATNQRAGGQANRFELDDPHRTGDMSVWYHVAYVTPSDRLTVYDHTAATTTGPHTRIALAQNVAWHVARMLQGHGGGIAQPGQMPSWARPRTGTADGPSAGVLYALADLDLLTPGPLAGDLRVAGTGAIASDGTVMPVRLVNAKLAAAQLAHVDVFFAPNQPDTAAQVTVIASAEGPANPDRTIGDWLNTDGYEHAGRIAATRPTVALVEIDDVRQALAWLCGRTQLPATCALAHSTDSLPLAAARPYNNPGIGLQPQLNSGPQ